jgi:hypothetical protein
MVVLSQTCACDIFLSSLKISPFSLQIDPGLQLQFDARINA